MVGHMLASGNARKSWRSTRVAQQLGIDYPIIQAPFGGLPSQRLTATVSNLGGLSSLGAVTLGSSAIREVIAEIVPSDIERFWLGHANRTVGDYYSMLKKNVTFRKQIADKIGVGFELPESISAPVVPPKTAVVQVQQAVA